MGLIGLTRDAAGNKLSEAAVASITAPTLLLWGEADTWTPLAQAEQLQALLPTVSGLTTFPASGHQPMEEAPQAFNDALLAFLKAD